VTAVTFTSSHELHTIALTGFCGGLTTFSSALAVPGVLAREHHWKYSAALLIATPLLGVAAYYLGGRFA
jgi:fluoride ion exporter CrcB/FEX